MVIGAIRRYLPPKPMPTASGGDPLGSAKRLPTFANSGKSGASMVESDIARNGSGVLLLPTSLTREVAGEYGPNWRGAGDGTAGDGTAGDCGGGDFGLGGRWASRRSCRCLRTAVWYTKSASFAILMQRLQKRWFRPSSPFGERSTSNHSEWTDCINSVFGFWHFAPMKMWKQNRYVTNVWFYSEMTAN